MLLEHDRSTSWKHHGSTRETPNYRTFFPKQIVPEWEFCFHSFAELQRLWMWHLIQSIQVHGTRLVCGTLLSIHPPESGCIGVWFKHTSIEICEAHIDERVCQIGSDLHPAGARCHKDYWRKFMTLHQGCRAVSLMEANKRCEIKANTSFKWISINV